MKMIPMNRIPWTDEDDQLLRENYRQKNNEELSKMLGVLPNGLPRHTAEHVETRLRQALMLSRNVRLTPYLQEIARKARRGATIGDLAEEYGVDYQKMKKFLNSNRIRTERRNNQER